MMIGKLMQNELAVQVAKPCFKDSNHLIMYLVFVVEVDFLCVRSSHMVPKRTFPQNCCAKAELATLELQKQSLFGPCKSFEKFGGLN